MDVREPGSQRSELGRVGFFWGRASIELRESRGAFPWEVKV